MVNQDDLDQFTREEIMGESLDEKNFWESGEYCRECGRPLPDISGDYTCPCGACYSRDGYRPPEVKND